MWRLVKFSHVGGGIVVAVVVALAASARSPVDATSGGRWREKVRVAWDTTANASVRRPVRVFDPHPELDLDFHWEPYPGAGTDAQGTVHGPGRLTWRQRGSAAWDSRAITSDYVGQLSDGRPHGAGRLALQSGLSYDGEWRNGHMAGRGHLRLPTGDDYQGDFAAGRPHGSGRYTAADGTSFDGPFRSGEREGVGVLTLADGTAYRSRWENGREVARTLLTQAPSGPAWQAAPAQGPPGTSGVVLNLFVDRKQNTEYGNADPDLTSYLYEGQLAGNLLKLRLASQELMGLWKGNGTIYKTGERNSGELFEAVEQFGPVFLVVDVTNEGGQAVQIDTAHVDVEQSYTDLQPYLTIRSDYYPQSCGPMGEEGASGHVNPTFELANAGWGAVRNATVRYAFGDESGPRTQSFTVRVDDFVESQGVTTQGGLEATGFDIEEAAGDTFECESGDELPSCLAELQENGLFGELSGALFLDGACVLTRASGRIDYTWVDAQGAPHQRQSPISVDIPLLAFNFIAGAEMGAAGPVERNIRPVKLALDRKNYRVTVGIRGQLAPRENRRFALSLAADKSSAHFFKVALQLADGSTVSSPRVDLLYFRPQLPAYEMGSEF